MHVEAAVIRMDAPIIPRSWSRHLLILLARVDVVLLVVSTIPFRIFLTNWCRVHDLWGDVLVSFSVSLRYSFGT